MPKAAKCGWQEEEVEEECCGDVSHAGDGPIGVALTPTSAPQARCADRGLANLPRIPTCSCAHSSCLTVASWSRSPALPVSSIAHT